MDSLRSGINNPVCVWADSGADSGVRLVGTTVAPGYDANDNVSEVERPSGITLAGVTASDVKEASADHVLGYDKRVG